ncbi:EVE domain-containing protein [Candidatus Mesenet endosymbiont of Agriotes lineatus]|uniref:EVE domain-containing protein n=1 Tax=Candidatus Mesenet endosymbiont of Agriotes lineatus TaxID=3077948 RepID=UPI0030D16EBA
MQFWLLKVEPSVYPWESIIKDKITSWDGVYNHQAQKYMKSMKVNDLAFFYHTEKEKTIVGIVKVYSEYYCNNNARFGVVDVEYFKPLEKRVTLGQIKQNTDLQNMLILKQPRLSVSSVLQREWDAILQMSAK